MHISELGYYGFGSFSFQYVAFLLLSIPLIHPQLTIFLPQNLPNVSSQQRDPLYSVYM